MAAPTRTPRTSWVEEGLRALGVGGPDAVRIERLAEGLGVTKGGFYWHFDGRRALLDEMLDAWERVVVDEVMTRVESGGGDAADRLRRLFALATSNDEMMAVELAIREWARRESHVAERLERVDDRRMDYMRGLFSDVVPDRNPAEVEVRCFVAFSLFVANPYIHARHGPRTRAEIVTEATRRLLAG